LKFKYSEENIPNAIATAILEYEKQSKKGRAHYIEIYRRITSLLGHPISQRQFGKHLDNMVHEKILNKFDPTSKRGSRVHFSLSEKGKRKHRLKIIGTDKQTEKRRSLYQLLIFFEEFVKRELITERQLNRFLRQIGASINDLQKIKVSDAGFPKITHFKSIKGVGIVRWVDRRSETELGGPSYYVVIPGFTAREISTYLKKLKMGKEPRPFSYYHGITDVPFVSYMDYTKKEVNDAIDSLSNDGLINEISDVFPGETRFRVKEHLRSFIKDVWDVHLLDLRLFDEKLGYNKKPTDEDKRYLASLYGEKNVGRILALTYPTRVSYKKEINRNKEKESIAKLFMQDFDNYRKSLIRYINKTHEGVIKEYEIANELVMGILHPSSRKESN
jgi:hypothetical protein